MTKTRNVATSSSSSSHAKVAHRDKDSSHGTNDISEPRMSLPRRIVKTLRSLSASRRSVPSNHSSAGDASQTVADVQTPSKSDKGSPSSSAAPHSLDRDEAQTPCSPYAIQGAWASALLHQTLGSFRLLRMLLEADVMYHAALRSQQNPTSPQLPWRDSVDSYTRILHLLMLEIQTRWGPVLDAARSNHDIIDAGDDDLIGSKRDRFFRQLWTLRHLPAQHHSAVPPQQEPFQDTDTPLISNKKTMGSPASHNPILSTPEMQSLLSALADVLVRLANASMRDLQFLAALQYLQDARCCLHLPPLRVPTDRNTVSIDIGTPMRKQTQASTLTSNFSPSSSASSTTPLSQSPGMNSHSTDKYKLSSDNHNYWLLNRLDDVHTLSHEYHVNTSLPSTMTPDQGRIHTMTLHNFIVLCSQPMKDDLSPTPGLDLNHLDTVLHLYSDCLRWKRRTLRILEKEKHSSNTQSNPHKEAIMSLSHTLVNIGQMKTLGTHRKLRSIPLTTHEHPSPPNTHRPHSSTSSSPHHPNRWIKAENFYKQALCLRVQLHGLDHQSVASNLMHLGYLYFCQGKMDLAIRSYQEVVRIRLLLQEEQSLLTAITFYNMAVAHYLMGQYEPCKDCAAQALLIRMKSVEHIHSVGPNIASILYALGLAQSSLGECEDAKNNFHRAWIIRKKFFPPNHLLMLNVTMAKGIDSLNEGYLEEAINTFVQVYRLRSHRLGLEHPKSLEALHFLALAIRDQGHDLHVAMEILHFVLECRCKYLGEEDTKSIETMCTLAECYRKGKKWEDALSLARRALDLCQLELGTDHMLYPNVLLLVGEIQWDSGDMDGALISFQSVLQSNTRDIQKSDIWLKVGQIYLNKAEYPFATQAYLECLKLMETLSHHSDPSYWKTLSSLGQAQYKCGDLKASHYSFSKSSYYQSMCFLRDQSLDNSFGTRDILMMALEKIRMQLLSLEETHDPNGDIVQINDDLEHLAVTLNILGVINQEMGSLDEAIESFDLCFLTRNIQPSRDYAALGHTADTLGLLYFGAGKHQKALSAFRDALSIKESGLGEQSIDVARTLNNMGNVYFASGNLVEAIEHYEQSLEIKKRVLGNIHEEVANTLNNIAHVLFKSDRFNESLEMYMEVFQIRHLLHGNDNLGLALTYSNIGDVHLKMGHMEDASVCLERCLQIKESHNANRNEEGVRIMESLALIYGKLGRWKRAEDLYSTVVNIRTTSLGQDKTEALCNSLKCLAMSLMEQRLFHECLPHLYEALRIRTLYVLTSSSDEISELMQLINFCKSRQ